MNYKVHHTAISVKDLQKSITFYEEFGFKKVHQFDEPDGSLSIAHLKLGITFLEIFAYKHNLEQPSVFYEYGNDLHNIGVKHLALEVEDIQKALLDLRKKGLADSFTKIAVGRTKVSYFFIQDPDGVWVEVIHDGRYS